MEEASVTVGLCVYINPLTMEKAFDSTPSPGMELPTPSRKPSKPVWSVLTVFVLTALYFFIDLPLSVRPSRPHVRVPFHAADTLAKCRSLSVKPAPPPGFTERVQSDRYEAGTTSVLIRNASIWTGLNDGADVVRGDILLEKGLIKRVRDANALLNNDNPIDIVDAKVSPSMINDYSSTFK